MINVSNEYKKYIADSADSTLSRDFTAKADIELADSTVLNITEEDIVLGGLKINDATSANNSFQIGTAIINQCTLMLNNIGGKFDQYDFTDAIIRPSIGLNLSETTEWLKKGVFAVDEPTVASSVISLVALDNMNKFDTEFSNVTQSFPCTTLQLLQSVCLHCGVYLSTISFLNSDFTIERRPSDEATTCREIVAWIGQISGNFARCNINGALELKWYDLTTFEETDSLDGGRFDNATPYSSGDNVDGGNFTDYSSGDNIDGGTFLDMKGYHHIYSLGSATIGTDDVVITGIQVKAMGTESDYGETVLFGSKGYVIVITDNPLITENKASIIANSVGAKIVGMRFRPCSITAIADPSREGGDIAKLSHKGNTYHILLTNLSSQIGSNDNLSCDAETPSRNNSTRYSAETKVIVEARKLINNEKSSRQIAIDELNDRLTNSSGLYNTEEEKPDGSKISYSHDKPTLAESSIVWKFTAEAIGLSTDGGITYPYGLTIDGNVIANILETIGINAEWIKVLTNFTVGDNFSVNSEGSLVAKNADIRGHIEADSGEIAGMDIGANGFEKVYKVNDENFTVALEMLENGFALSTESTNNTVAGGINVIHDANGVPSMNIYVRDENGVRNDKIYLNRQPILSNSTSLNNRLTHLVNWAITTFNYDPLS